MRELVLVVAAFAFPGPLLLGGLVVALRRRVPPVRFATVGLFLALGLAAIVLDTAWLLLADALLLGRLNGPFYYAVVTAALPEEVSRYLVIRWGLARRPRAGPAEAMLLGGLVGLTFGAYEHVAYAAEKGWWTWLARSFTSVPYHALAGAVLGACASAATRTGRPWGVAGLCGLVLAHGLADWPLAGPEAAPSRDGWEEFLRSGWAGNVASLLAVAAPTAALARAARGATADRASPAGPARTMSDES